MNSRAQILPERGGRGMSREGNEPADREHREQAEEVGKQEQAGGRRITAYLETNEEIPAERDRRK